MKKTSQFITYSILLANICYAQSGKPFSIDGKLSGQQTGKIYMTYQVDENKYQTDSTELKNGSFTFSGQIPHPVSASVYLDRNARMSESAQIFIEPSKMNLALTKGEFDKAKLSGSKAQEEYKRMESACGNALQKLMPLRKSYDKLNEEYIKARREKKDSAFTAPMLQKLDQIKGQMEPYSEEVSTARKDFIEKNPGSYVSAYMLRSYLNDMNLARGEKIYSSMPAGIRESMYGKAVKKDLEGLRQGSPGSEAYVFATKDINGNMLSLADFKGKYVLVDFWASWCGPCRKGNPHLKNLYSKYKDKGLEIIGISDDDRDLAAWKKAVEQDGIGIWKHVLRGFDMQKLLKHEPNPDDISNYYGIHTLPTKILIDPKGMIIGRYGGGGENDEAMDKKMEEIFR